jgi:glycosyltransferase involved in cell wall biosynthesis
MRLAWFSPVPPVPSGIAVCTADLVQGLAADHEIDLYVDEPVAASARLDAPRPVRSAHDFVWRHQRAPYDLTVYQLGNSSHHDYSWPYLFRYPGLVVLHDAHLHHARAAALLRTKRAADYRAEFIACHPEAGIDQAELAVAGFDSHLYYAWPMTKLVVDASRLTVTHAPLVASALAAGSPSAHVDVVRLAHGTPCPDDDRRAARLRVNRARGLPPDALLLGVFGGLTPDKRLPQILDAFASLLPYAPHARLLLAGAPARHYDVAADVRARGLDRHVVLTGYLETTAELTDCVAACDISINMRWPTAREISGPWLRALAAGLPTITVDLAHTIDVPSLDPRTWRPHGAQAGEPVTVAIDILDEDHSLRLALRRLAADEPLRRRLGQAARAYWAREHSPARMLDDYRRAIARAAATPDPGPALPPHLVARGDRRLDAVLGEMMLLGVDF